MARDLYSALENALDYQGHSEVCGCSERQHTYEWTISFTLREDDVRELLRRWTRGGNA